MTKYFVELYYCLTAVTNDLFFFILEEDLNHDFGRQTSTANTKVNVYSWDCLFALRVDPVRYVRPSRTSQVLGCWRVKKPVATAGSQVKHGLKGQT